MEGKNSYRTDGSRGGLFIRSVFCGLMLLALWGLFAVDTEFSKKAEDVFKWALTEDVEGFIPDIWAKGALIREEEGVEDKREYVPEKEGDIYLDTYPNPIIMPSETVTENGYAPYSEI